MMCHLKWLSEALFGYEFESMVHSVDWVALNKPTDNNENTQTQKTPPVKPKRIVLLHYGCIIATVLSICIYLFKFVKLHAALSVVRIDVVVVVVFGRHRIGLARIRHILITAVKSSRRCWCPVSSHS